MVKKGWLAGCWFGCLAAQWRRCLAGSNGGGGAHLPSTARPQLSTARARRPEQALSNIEYELGTVQNEQKLGPQPSSRHAAPPPEPIPAPKPYHHHDHRSHRDHPPALSLVTPSRDWKNQILHTLILPS